MSISRSRASVVLASTLPFALAAFVACSSAPATVPATDAGPAASVAAAPARGPTAVAAAPTSSVPLPKADFREEDFSETDHGRDPFRSFAKIFADQGKTRVKSQRQVMLDRFTIDELRLIGLVTRTETPRAMLVDPSGRGWVVTKGQFIGRAEVVHAGGPGGVDYELNWRVERIREGDLVLIREDPAHSDVPPATRVLALRATETEEKQ